MRPYNLTDEQLSTLINAMQQHGIYMTKSLLKTVKGIIYRLVCGVPWRDLPAHYGRWNSVYSCFRRWSRKKIIIKAFRSIVSSISKENDSSNSNIKKIYMDGTIVKAHQHSSGAPKKQKRAVGKSRGGWTTNIHLLTDSQGLPRRFLTTGGQINDCTMATRLLNSLQHKKCVDVVIADKGYDSEDIRKAITKMGATPAIPRKKNSTIGNADLDRDSYKTRHTVENTHGWLKKFRAFATRYDKLKATYDSTVALACSMMWLKKLL